MLGLFFYHRPISNAGSMRAEKMKWNVRLLKHFRVMWNSLKTESKETISLGWLSVNECSVFCFVFIITDACGDWQVIETLMWSVIEFILTFSCNSFARSSKHEQTRKKTSLLKLHRSNNLSWCPFKADPEPPSDNIVTSATSRGLRGPSWSTSVNPFAGDASTTRDQTASRWFVISSDCEWVLHF